MTIASKIGGLFGGGDKTGGIGGLFGDISEGLSSGDPMTNVGFGMLTNPHNRGQGALMGLQMGQQAQDRRKKKEEEDKRKEAYQRALGTFNAEALGPETSLGGGVTSQDLAPMGPGDMSSTGLSRQQHDLLSALGPQAGAGALMNMQKGPTAPSGYSYGPDGSLSAIPGGPASLETLRARRAIPTREETRTVESFGKKQVAEAGSSAHDGYSTIGEIDKAIELYNQPGVGGSFENKARELGAATLGQIPGIGSGLEDAIDPGQDATRAQVQGRVILGRLLPAITGETGGRYSDKERAFAQAATKTLGTASQRQIQTALQQLRAIEMRATKRKELFSRRLPNLTSREATAQYHRDLMAQGMSDEQAITAIQQLYTQFGITGDLVE